MVACDLLWEHYFKRQHEQIDALRRLEFICDVYANPTTHTDYHRLALAANIFTAELEEELIYGGPSAMDQGQTHFISPLSLGEPYLGRDMTETLAQELASDEVQRNEGITEQTRPDSRQKEPVEGFDEFLQSALQSGLFPTKHELAARPKQEHSAFHVPSQLDVDPASRYSPLSSLCGTERCVAKDKYRTHQSACDTSLARTGSHQIKPTSSTSRDHDPQYFCSEDCIAPPGQLSGHAPGKEEGKAFQSVDHRPLEPRERPQDVASRALIREPSDDTATNDTPAASLGSSTTYAEDFWRTYPPFSTNRSSSQISTSEKQLDIRQASLRQTIDCSISRPSLEHPCSFSEGCDCGEDSTILAPVPIRDKSRDHETNKLSLGLSGPSTLEHGSPLEVEPHEQHARSTAFEDDDSESDAFSWAESASFNVATPEEDQRDTEKDLFALVTALTQDKSETFKLPSAVSNGLLPHPLARNKANTGIPRQTKIFNGAGTPGPQLQNIRSTKNVRREFKDDHGDSLNICDGALSTANRPMSPSSVEIETLGFPKQFMHSRGNEYFCDVDEEYLTDRFNLTGLNTEVQHYQYALDLVTDVFDLDCDDEIREQIEKSARHLYGLVHARYIVTTRGLQKMMEKYKNGDFGKCPRVACDLQPLLPMGQHDNPNVSAVKLYCARCEDLYNPKSSRHSSIDGAYFGTSFHNILFQVYPHLLPPKSQKRYEPRIYGFKVHAPAALARWQADKRDEMKDRLFNEGIETGFEEEEREEEMIESEEEEADGIDDMFEGQKVHA